MRTKFWIKILMVVVIVAIIGFSDLTFATDEKEIFGTVERMLDFIVSILSWIRVLFAKLAGEFLTNKWVYGEAIGLDVLLRRYRNIMKNIANFGLGFYFIYVVFKGLITQGKEDVIKNVKNTLLWTLAAGVGIQMSRFLTSVIIDVSTITLTAVGSFPSQIVSKNNNVEVSIKQSFCNYFEIEPCNDNGVNAGQEVMLFDNNSKANEFLTTMKKSLDNTMTRKSLFDKLMPNQDNISGPLYYMGFVILDSSKVPSVKSFDLGSMKTTILNLIILGGTTIIYSIEMGVLCILALMRIIYLWMFIVLSPLTILLVCIRKAGQKFGGGIIDKLIEQVDRKPFLINVFKPTIIVLFIGLTVILTSLIKNIINKNGTDYSKPIDIGGVTISHAEDPDEVSHSKGDKTYTTTVEGAGLKYTFSHLGKGLGELLLSIITVILVYMIIRIAVNMGGGKDFVSEKIGKMHNGIENAMKNIPFVPVSGYDKDGIPMTKHLSFNDTKNLSGRYITKSTNSVREKTSGQVDEIVNKFLNNNETLSNTEKVKLNSIYTEYKGENILREWKNYFDKKDNDGKYEHRTENGKGMMLNPNTPDKTWIGIFTKWLNEVNLPDITDSDWKKIVESRRDQNTDEKQRNLASLFDNEKFATKYANEFGYNGTYINFKGIQDLDISKIPQ